MLTLSQTGSLFKPRTAYLPQELLGKVSHWGICFSLVILSQEFSFFDIISDLEKNYIPV